MVVVDGDVQLFYLGEVVVDRDVELLDLQVVVIDGQVVLFYLQMVVVDGDVQFGYFSLIDHYNAVELCNSALIRADTWLYILLHCLNMFFGFHQIPLNLFQLIILITQHHNLSLQLSISQL